MTQITLSDLKTDPGKYVRLAQEQDIMITRYGKIVAKIVTADPEVGEPHNLRTRRIGAAIAVEVHVRVDGAMSVARSHELTVDIERRLRARFGQGTIISIHVEPVKCPAEAGIPGGDPPSCP